MNELYNLSTIPEIQLPGISQADFEDAFLVMQEAYVNASPEAPVYGFTHPFCGPGGAYGVCWWQLDTSLALCGAKWVNTLFAENVLRGFKDVQREKGRIPLHGPDTLLDPEHKCSSVPKLFQAAYEVLERTQDAGLLEEIYPLLKGYLDWWLTERIESRTGLIYAIVEEFLPGRNVPLCAIETNVEVVVGCKIVSKLAARLGNAEEAKYYEGKMRHHAELIRTRLWDDERKTFLSYDPSTGGFDDKVYSTIFDTLKNGVANEAQTDRLLSYLVDDRLFQWNGVCLTTAAKTCKCYNETPGVYAACQWEGSIWTMRNYTVIEGLDDIGRFDLSAYLSWRTVNLFNGNYAEFLNPPDGSGHGVKRYVWTASQYIQIIIERIFGIRYSNYLGEIRIMPNISDECYGKTLEIRRLTFPGGAQLDVSVSSESDGSAFSVTYTLTPGQIEEQKTLVIAHPSFGNTYRVNNCAYSVVDHGRGKLCRVALPVELRPSGNNISGKVVFVKDF